MCECGGVSAWMICIPIHAYPMGKNVVWIPCPNLKATESNREILELKLDKKLRLTGKITSSRNVRAGCIAGEGRNRKSIRNQ